MRRVHRVLHGRISARSAPFDCVLWAVGRGPLLNGLELARTGAQLDPQGFIVTDRFQVTSTPGIYAIGDVTGRAQLTPVAIAAGRRLADRVFGGQEGRYLDYDNIPTVIFGRPPIGTVGLTEEQARQRHGAANVRIYRSGFVPLYHALTRARPRSEMKLITAGPEERVVGLHVVGPGADEMLQGFAVALRMGATKQDFDDTVAIHPTNGGGSRHDALAAGALAQNGEHMRSRRRTYAAPQEEGIRRPRSTSMPMPCTALAHPTALAHLTKGVAALP